MPPDLRVQNLPELLVIVKRVLNSPFSREGGDVLECSGSSLQSLN